VAPIFVSFKYTLKLPFWSKDRHRRHGHGLWLQLTVKCPRNAPSFSALISSDGLGFQNSKNFLWITGLPHSAEVYPNFFSHVCSKKGLTQLPCMESKRWQLHVVPYEVKIFATTYEMWIYSSLADWIAYKQSATSACCIIVSLVHLGTQKSTTEKIRSNRPF